jgi:hypothetical protein
MFSCLLLEAHNENDVVTVAFDNRAVVIGIAGDSDSDNVFVASSSSSDRNTTVLLHRPNDSFHLSCWWFLIGQQLN